MVATPLPVNRRFSRRHPRQISWATRAGKPTMIATATRIRVGHGSSIGRMRGFEDLQSDDRSARKEVKG